MLTYEQCIPVVSAIYRVEGGSHTHYPYGIKLCKTTHPRDVCIRTVLNESKRDNISHVDRYFIYKLSDRYCPASVDPIGHINWEHNMIAILHL